MVSYMLHQSFLMRNNVFGGSDLDSAKAGKVGRAICPLLSTPPVLSAFGLDFWPFRAQSTPPTPISGNT